MDNGYLSIRAGFERSIQVLGYNRSVFDAPSMFLAEGGDNTAVVWIVQGYLTLEDAGFSKNVIVIPGGAFTQESDINVDENSSSESQIVVRRANIAVESE